MDRVTSSLRKGFLANGWYPSFQFMCQKELTEGVGGMLAYLTSPVSNEGTNFPSKHFPQHISSVTRRYVFKFTKYVITIFLEKG